MRENNSVFIKKVHIKTHRLSKKNDVLVIFVLQEPVEKLSSFFLREPQLITVLRLIAILLWAETQGSSL